MQLSLLYHYANVISTFNLKNIFFFNKILMVALHLKKLSYILHKILNQRMPSLHWLTTRLSIDLSYLSLYLMFNSVNCIITLKVNLSISELFPNSISQNYVERESYYSSKVIMGKSTSILKKDMFLAHKNNTYIDYQKRPKLSVSEI